MNDTIVALSSGRPPAAIAVVRTSGPDAFAAAEALVGPVPAARKAALRRLTDPRDGALIDEALVVRFDAPNSATGEDIVEYQCHARAIATAPDPEALANEIVDGDLSVRQAEHLAKKVRPGPGSDIGRASARNYQRPVDADLAALERQLSDLLGIRVKVSHGKSGGSVSLHYSTLDQLDLICQRLSGEPI